MDVDDELVENKDKVPPDIGTNENEWEDNTISFSLTHFTYETITTKISLNNIKDSETSSVESISSCKVVPLESKLVSEDVIKTLSRQSLKDVLDFILVFGLWCKKEHIKQQTYKGLWKVLLLLDYPQAQNLPKQLLTLLCFCCSQLSLPTIQQTNVPVRQEK